MARATGVSPGSSLAEGSIEPSKAPSSVTTATGPLQSVTSVKVVVDSDGDRRLDVVDDPTPVTHRAFGRKSECGPTGATADQVVHLGEAFGFQTARRPGAEVAVLVEAVQDDRRVTIE